jgi:hypothetical protein
MYCSSCGVSVAQGLSYCNYCGAKLSGPKGDSVSKSSEVRAESLIGTMAAVFIFGLAAITVLMGVMKAVLGLPVKQVLAFALLPFLVMLLLEGVFIRILLRRNRGPEETGDRALLKEKTTKELSAAQQRLLSEPAPSVTDQTTRTLEPVHGERKSK